MLIHGLVVTLLFGLFAAGSGSPPVAALLAIALMIVLVITSNAKHAMLGEPLLFSDFALLVWIFRHPRFYVTALSPRQRWMLIGGGAILLFVLCGSFMRRGEPHLEGAGIALLAAAALFASLGGTTIAALAPVPNLGVDLARHGLIATLLLYWLRWRATPDPAPCQSCTGAMDEPEIAPPSAQPEIVIIVQCESFADPMSLTDDLGAVLPGLAQARACALQWGDLEVSGFGAYTMRTEYAVLFGRSEAELGFRRFDPFLTASGEASYSLPSRLASHGYRSLFVHPHDMRFYRRDRLMPAIGFDRLIGEDSFPKPVSAGRYVDDRTLGVALGGLVEEAVGPTLIYAVTMENHGPWNSDPTTGLHDTFAVYLHHLHNSDDMLSDLIDRLSHAGRSALLVFFGDHRPSIPGVTTPGGARHTPYVMMRFSADGQCVTGAPDPVDLTPADLHLAILDCIQNGQH